jgi:hypothetical protein
MEDRGVDRVRDHDRVGEPVAELLMLLEAVPRLEDRRVRELAVELGDARVRPVVEAAVDADRPVDPMHHPAVDAREALEAGEVEVERVEETGSRPAGQTVELYLDPARVELAVERAQELMSASGGRRRELVEERRVRAAAARGEPGRLRARAAQDATADPPRDPRNGAKLHGAGR